MNTGINSRQLPSDRWLTPAKQKMWSSVDLMTCTVSPGGLILLLANQSSRTSITIDMLSKTYDGKNGNLVQGHFNCINVGGGLLMKQLKTSLFI